MSLLFDTIYCKSDLERRTRLFYEAYASKSSKINDVFIDSYGIKYELVFRNKPYESAVYSLLKRYYRNEYYIKKSFVIHNLSNSSSVTFTEFPVNDSRADIVSINGHSAAFEIKTNYDSLTRLGKQINDYSKCFEYIFVICPEKKVAQVTKLIPIHCGIYSYNSARINSVFKKNREALISPFISPTVQLCSINKEELLLHFGASSRSEVAEKNSPHAINCKFKDILKIRYLDKWNEFRNECNLILRN
ncbi:MAG: sce7726 family protein [Bacilli bacterium]|jgi:hypothetical protein